MDFKIFILFFLILLFACAEKKEVKEYVDELSSSTIDTSIKKNENTFTADSSYVKYWCSTKVLEKTANSIVELRASTIAEFLASFHRDCSKNTEYSVWANQLLFEVALRNPSSFMGLLHKNKSLDKELILEGLKSPVNNEINLKKILEKIEKSSGPADIKKEIIHALKIAQSENQQ